MRAWKDDYAMTALDRIVIEYEAVLNQNAVTGSAGNPNAVNLTYTADPGTGGEGAEPIPPEKTPTDLVTVFTYQIRINKTDENGAPLEGAGFTLFKKIDNKWTQIGEEISGVTTYDFRGVDTGDYRIKETKVPSGYHQARDIDITVHGTYDRESDFPRLRTLTVTPESAGFTINSTTRTDPASDPGQNPSAGSSTDPGADPEKTHIETDGVAEGSIINLSGARLPSTGGPGNGIYYTAGILLALGAALLLFKKPAGTA